MSKPYISLGIYKPPMWSPKLVGHTLTGMTKELGLMPITDPKHRHQSKAPWNSKRLCAYVRRRTVRNPRAASWHVDGDLTGSRDDDALVLWASNNPTEIRAGGKVYQPRPYEIILYRNAAGEHRRPPNAPRVRWFFRQRVEVPDHMELP